MTHKKKTTIIVFLLKFSIFSILAQTSVSPMSIEGFENAPFQFKGERVIMGDRVDTKLTKNIYLFTKSQQGVFPDTIYAQQFVKEDESWTLLKDTTIISDETLILWGNRKAYFDKEGLPVAFFTYCTGDPTTQSRSAVYLIAYYQGQTYSLTEYRGESTIASKNFIELPSDITMKIFDYWNRLDRWKTN